MRYFYLSPWGSVEIESGVFERAIPFPNGVKPHEGGKAGNHGQPLYHVPVDMEVWYIDLHDDQLAQAMADPSVHFWTGDPEAAANYLLAQGVTAELYQAKLQSYNYQDPEFLAALSAVTPYMT